MRVRSELARRQGRAGRPSWLAALTGKIVELIDESRCGIVVRTGDSEGLLAAISRLRDDVALREEYGRNARKYFEQKYGKHIALAAWSAIL